MAKNERSTRPDIERTTSYWGYCLTGTGDALAQSGEVQPDWLLFGLDKDDRGRTVRTRTLTRLDRRKVTIKDIGRGRFDVRVFFTADEADQQRRLHEESVKREAEERYEQGRREREPRTEGDFRARAEELIDFAFRFAQSYVGQGEGRFHFDTATFDACVKARFAVVTAMKKGRVISRRKSQRPALQIISGGPTRPFIAPQ